MLAAVVGYGGDSSVLAGGAGLRLWEQEPGSAWACICRTIMPKLVDLALEVRHLHVPWVVALGNPAPQIEARTTPVKNMMRRTVINVACAIAFLSLSCQTVAILFAAHTATC